MAREVASTVGSGTIPHIRAITTPNQRGSLAGAKNQRMGTQVVCANPEDFVAVDAFAVSGIAVSTSPTEIIGPTSNPLPRCRSIRIQNLGPNNLIIAHTQDALAEGFVIPAPTNVDINEQEIPLLHNNSVFAAGSGGSTQIRMIIV